MKMPRTPQRLVKSFSTQVIDAKSLFGTCLASEAAQENTNKCDHKGQDVVDSEGGADRKNCPRVKKMSDFICLDKQRAI